MKLKFLILLFVFSTPIFAQNLPRTDTQLWSDVTVTKPLLKAKDKKGKSFDRLSVFFNGTLRFGNHVRNLIDERIGFGFDVKLNHWLTLTPSYLYRSNNPTLNRRDYESRFRIAATLEKKWAKFSLRDRNLYEYRLRNSRADSSRYRNRLIFTYPILKNKKELFAPYVQNEIYYDFSAKDFTRDELAFGISRKINKNLTTDFYYLRQFNSGGNPKSLNVAGINLKIKLD